MDTEKRKRLEAAGWKVGTVKDLFDLTDEDMEVIEARIVQERAIKKQLEYLKREARKRSRRHE